MKSAKTWVKILLSIYLFGLGFFTFLNPIVHTIYIFFSVSIVPIFLIIRDLKVSDDLDEFYISNLIPFSLLNIPLLIAGIVLNLVF